ncbi:pyridoxal phosphate-dependent transferase [Cokeromyces recurvatus]|uniref:pyridoxal phosphate-dependent transferase n=1 Tax=Cokeromyces recurvatus TaxID=90255 RepID=UPI00221EA2F9|nr:pyridoxal phosphate-dependent transferase [Cokeromyces recurvatus]KAI7906487.1 pyridoxal phosphate-dependent transferase [Cokeromyces recurvatus]
MDYSKHISERSKARNPSAIRALMPYLNRKDMISLGAGQPNIATFPFAGLTITLKTGEKIEMDNNLFNRALSYDLSNGQPLLNEWLCELQRKEHKPHVDFALSIGSGSQDLLTKALEMMINDGDSVLVETPTYTGVLSFLETLNCDLADVATDEYGIIPESLENMLANWPESNPSGKKDQPRPHCLYTVPSGGNPTGISATLERKQAVYKICSKYDIIILEDDAYYYLQFTENRTPSYFSMDLDGRVLRCDSMSKILSSGLRLGWITGPKPLIERINMHTMVTNLQPSGLPQAITYTLLEKWGHEGFFLHVNRVADFYREKRDQFIECLNRQLKGRAEWIVPNAGMFVWLRLLGGITDSYDLVMTKALKENVLAIPGIAFMPHKTKNEYIRVSYSNVTKEDMAEAVRRLALVIDREAALNDVKINSDL